MNEDFQPKASISNVFKGANITQASLSPARLPEQILTFNSPEFGDKPEPIFFEKTGETAEDHLYYIKDDKGEQIKISYDLIKNDLAAGKQAVPLPIVFDMNDPDKFLADSELQATALAYKNNTAINGPTPSFKTSDITGHELDPKQAFSKASLTEKIEPSYEIKPQNPEIDVS